MTDLGTQMGGLGLLGAGGMHVVGLLAEANLIGPVAEIVAQFGLPGVAMIAIWKLYEKSQAELKLERDKSDALHAMHATTMAAIQEKVGVRLEDNTAATVEQTGVMRVLCEKIDKRDARAARGEVREPTTPYGAGTE